MKTDAEAVEEILDADADHVITQLWVFVTGLDAQAKYQKGEYPALGSFEFLCRGRN